MVSAVFHGPFDAPTLPAPAPSASLPPHNAPTSVAEKDHSTPGSMQKSLRNDETKATPAPATTGAENPVISGPPCCPR